MMKCKSQDYSWVYCERNDLAERTCKMKFVKIGNFWINPDKVNWITKRNGKTLIYLTGSDIPISFDESIEVVVNRLNCKLQQVEYAWINPNNINSILERGSEIRVSFTGDKTTVVFRVSPDMIINHCLGTLFQSCSTKITCCVCIL